MVPMRLIAYLCLLLVQLVCDWAEDAHFENSIFSESGSSQPLHNSSIRPIRSGRTSAACNPFACHLSFTQTAALLPDLGSTDSAYASPVLPQHDLCYCFMS